MQLGFWTGELPNNLDSLGFALHPQSARHIGVLYHLDDGVVRFCHFAWHGDLKNEPARPGYGWANSYMWGNSGLDPYTKRFLAHEFDVISRANPDSIPYGIDQSGSCFDANNQLLPLPLGKGMTCASFIVSVFRSRAIPLILEETWPVDRPIDQEWAISVVQLLEQHGAPLDHVRAIKANLRNVTRYHPSQIGGSLSSSDPPVDFTEAERLSKQILAELERADLALAGS